MSQTINITLDTVDWPSLVEDWSLGHIPQELFLQYLNEARRGGSRTLNHLLDEQLVRATTLARQDAEDNKAGLTQAREAIEETKAILDRFGAAPLLPAIFISVEETRFGAFALVATGGGRRVVAVAQDVDPIGLRCGDGVLLNAEQGVLFAATKSANPPVGELAAFERYSSDGRVVIKASSNEQVVLQPAAVLDDVGLRPGDTIRWDRSSKLALEKMSDPEENPFVIPQVEEIPLSKVGGQRGNLARLRSALTNGLLYPDRSKAYGLASSNTILLYGPPGSGKTYLTRAIFSELQRQSGKKVMFAVVKASSWESPFVGVTQSNISSLFASLRQVAAEGNIAAVLIDEIDAVGRTRGSLSGHHSDRALGTLLTELSGFQKLENVSVVGTVNRKDLLDSALLSRFGVEIPIDRPDLRSAREILAVHLDESLPYSSSGARQEMIELVVSRLFAPNADGDVCTLKLRDGRVRTVSARELVSARLIEQISESARRRALDRWNLTAENRFDVEDMEVALEETRARLVATLTPYNAHQYLEGLAADEMILSVEPISVRIHRAQRYVSLS